MDGNSVYLGENKDRRMTFVPRQSYAELENSVFSSMHNIFNDMVGFESVAGFAKFFEKCPHGCLFHTLHSKKCVCAGQHQENCGVWPCVVNVFLPRMANREKVGLNNLSRNVNLNTQNDQSQHQEERHCPWRAHMSKRQIQNDKIFNEGTNDGESKEVTNSQGAMVVYKSFQELEKEEEETIKRLNLLKSQKNNMKLASQTKNIRNTRFLRIKEE